MSTSGRTRQGRGGYPPARLTHARGTIEVPPGGALTVVMVADTHGQPHPKSAVLIAALRPDHILHAGDIGDLSVLDGLAKLAPVSAVRGNIDGRTPGLPDAMTLDVRDAEGSLVTLLLVHIAVNGPRLRADVARLAAREKASLVVCGHSHVPFVGTDKGFTIVNPGSIGPRRFQLPILFGVMNVRREGITIHHVSCETGERWTP